MKAKFITTLLMSVFSIILFSCSNPKLQSGVEVISKIEKFRSENNRLPNNLTEIGIIENEGGPVYYEKKTESEYILWFGKELGESMTYDSQTKAWK